MTGYLFCTRHGVSPLSHCLDYAVLNDSVWTYPTATEGGPLTTARSFLDAFTELLLISFTVRRCTTRADVLRVAYLRFDPQLLDREHDFLLRPRPDLCVLAFPGVLKSSLTTSSSREGRRWHRDSNLGNQGPILPGLL